ncbi:MAG TPA: glycerophosphodiester phosphodiesterase family protein [Gammaproteobacteria bacterium]|nr:glycerophosphodiester phosphodiesterase family protein [Gammaproteobacteria bacterium]
MSKPILIAHRGEPETWPENSLAGFAGALAAGARHIETDVQITRDGIAVLCHDASLARMTGHDMEIATSDYAAMRDLPAGEPGRFGECYADLRLARLEEFVVLLQQWPQARAFIEIKPASLDAHGTAAVMDGVLSILDPVLPQCRLISFMPEALVYARECSPLPLGWVIPEWTPANRACATALAPQFLFCNRKRLPPPGEALWPGDWIWVVYTVNEVAEIRQFTERGIQMLETNTISKLQADLLQHGGSGCG